MRILWRALFFACICWPFSAAAVDPFSAQAPLLDASEPLQGVWIAPYGSDSGGNGTRAKPFYTPAKAALFGDTILALPGRYTEFGKITRGGTPNKPLRLRPVALGTVVFALQDAAQPAILAASHIYLEGIVLHGRELDTPGTCLRVEGSQQDITITKSKIDHCAVGIDAGIETLSHLTITESVFSDIQNQAMNCGQAACLHHRMARVRFEHLGYSSASSSAAILYSARSHDVRWRDVLLRDILGDGARFIGPAPSIANSQFIQIEGTALALERGGYLAKTDVAALKAGLAARVGDGLVIERSLFRSLAASSTPFLIMPDDESAPSSTLLLAYSRFEVPQKTLRLGGKKSGHQIIWNGIVLWFSHPSPEILLPKSDAVSPNDIELQPTITRQEASQLFFGEAEPAELFSPLFRGGETTYNPDGSRTITAGSELRGETSGQSYVLGQDDRVHFLVRESQRTAWYPYGSTNILKEERLEELLRGEDMTEPPGTLVKIPQRPHVYLVTAPNILRWITVEPLAYAYAGPRWASTIVTIPREEITQYEEGEPITNESTFEELDVLRQVPDPGDLFQKE